MKRTSIEAHRGWLMGGLFISVLGVPTLASAEAVSFVHDEYYLGKGGTPPTLEEMADDPLRYFRSEFAYATLRARFAEELGDDELTDEEFRVLLVSEQVELRPCVGQFATAGLVGENQQSRNVRNCYQDEMLIWLDVEQGEGEDWFLVGSQGCFNASWPYSPPQTPAPEPAPAPKPLQAETTYQPGFVVEIDDFNSCGCHIPGTTVRIPGSIQRRVPGFGQEN